MNAEDWSRVLIVLAIAGWISTVTIVRAARRLPEGALVERAVVAVVCSFAASLIAILASAFLLHVPLPPGSGFSLLVGACVMLNLPPLVWALALVSGKLS
jgi:hypothetical protein